MTVKPSTNTIAVAFSIGWFNTNAMMTEVTVNWAVGKLTLVTVFALGATVTNVANESSLSAVTAVGGTDSPV